MARIARRRHDGLTFPASGPSEFFFWNFCPGGAREDLSQYELQLAKKDFYDKAHTIDPVPRSTIRDRFLYFPVETPPGSTKGCILRIPASRGIPQEVLLKF